MFRHLHFKTLALLGLMLAGAGSAWADSYTKITSTDGLIDGEQYLVVCESKNKAMTSTISSNVAGQVDVTISSNKIVTVPETAAVITLKANGDNWNMVIDGKYFEATAAKKVALQSSASKPWTISFTSGEVKITSSTSTYGYLQYNASSPRFTTYTSAQTAIALYKKDPVIAVTGVTLDKKSTTLEVGETETLTATVAPSNASNKEVSWSTSNSDVATVNDGVVSAVGVGTATITVTTTDGSKTASCTVMVNAATKPTAVVSTVALDFGKMAINTAKSLTFTVTPANLSSALNISCDNYKYTVSPASIAADVTTETTITVTANPTAKSDDMAGTITISGGGLTEDKTVTLTATPYDPDEVVFDFSLIDFSSWSNSYNEHEITYPEIVVTFSAASKQSSTITDVPVQKKGDVVITTNRIGDTMKSVSFACRKWGSKSQTVALYYSTDGGDSWTQSGSASTTFSISDNALPANVNAVKLTSTDASNQVGIESVTIGFNVATEEPITLTSAGYATYCGDHNLDFAAAGLKAYKAAVNGDAVTFTELSGTVPAGTGVLLKGNEGSYNVGVTAAATADVTGNVLVGVKESQTADAGIYVLMNGASGVGFYKTTKTFTLTAHTAYLPATATARAFVALSGDETTAISDATRLVDSEKVNSEAYDLQGRRMDSSLFTLHSSLLKKGLYIIGGKKVSIK